MNTLSKSLAALGLAALMVAPASAQQGRGRGGPGGGMMMGRASVSMLLQNEGVRDELKLDDAQKSKVQEANRAAREKLASAREETQNLEGRERFAKIRELAAEADAEVLKSLDGVLKPEQLARLEGIRYQVLGAAAFRDEAVQKALKLTDEQKETVDKALADSASQAREAFQGGGDRGAAAAKFDEIRKEAVGKVVATLSDEQKSAYAKLIGDPYEVKFERRGR